MRKIRDKRIAIVPALAAMLLTAGILCPVYAFFGLFPFGPKTLAWGDMKQQVVPLLLEFKDILAGKTNFLLNLQNAGGMSFWGVFFFFLSSPFHFLVAFIPKSGVFYFVNVLVLVKLSLSAGTASLFFREEAPAIRGGLHVFFCVSYALCGYGLLYYQNLVWLDMLYLFPVLMTGFRRLIFENKAVLFTVALTAVITVNYYLSFMVLLALILMGALFLKNCVIKGERGRKAAKLGIGAVLALLLTAVVWLPSLLQCLRSARTSQGLVESIQSGGIFTELFTALPVLLCTAGVTALLPLSFIFPLTAKRKTLLSLFLLLCIPIFLEPVNKLWHTGSYQAFPVRYGYIPVFLGLWCLSDFLGEERRTASLLPKKKKPTFWLSLLGSSFLLAEGVLPLVFRLDDMRSYTGSLWFDDSSFYNLLLFALSAAGITWLFVFLWKKGWLKKKQLGYFLLSVCLIQGGFHSAVLIGPAAYEPLRGRAVLQTEGDLKDDGLYRVKQDYKFCDVNLLGAIGCGTLNHYTSLTDEAFLHVIKKLGYSSYWMETSACCGTELSDILLSNKYSLDENLTWEKTGSGNIGYILPAGAFPEVLENGDRFELQNALFRGVTFSNEEAFQRYAPDKQQGISLEDGEAGITLRKTGETAYLRYKISVGERETLYFDAFSENTNHLREKINGSFTVKVNGEALANDYPSQRSNGILHLGSYENETVQIEVVLHRDAENLRSFGVCGLKPDKVKSFTGVLKNGNFYANRNKISGTANADRSGQALFLSVPYAPGMEAYVNGKPVEIRIVLDCFLEIPLEQGENIVELRYIPRGIKTGAFLTVFGIVLCVFLILIGERKRERLFNSCGKAAWPLLHIAFGAVLLAVYLAPILIWMGKLFR